MVNKKAKKLFLLFIIILILSCQDSENTIVTPINPSIKDENSNYQNIYSILKGKTGETKQACGVDFEYLDMIMEFNGENCSIDFGKFITYAYRLNNYCGPVSHFKEAQIDSILSELDSCLEEVNCGQLEEFKNIDKQLQEICDRIMEIKNNILALLEWYKQKETEFSQRLSGCADEKCAKMIELMIQITKRKLECSISSNVFNSKTLFGQYFDLLKQYDRMKSSYRKASRDCVNEAIRKLQERGLDCLQIHWYGNTGGIPDCEEED